MRRSAVLLALTVPLALVAAACGGSSSEPGPAASPAAAAEVAPIEFQATTVDGEAFDGMSLAGRSAVLWFWAPWCTTCRSEAPGVAAAAASFAGDVEVIGVAGRGEVDAMRGFVADTGTDAITHLADQDGELWTRFGVVAQPAYAFVAADGTVEVVTGALGAEALASRMDALRAA
jgi:thiol-disulfide isomerase/thioredoxin